MGHSRVIMLVLAALIMILCAACSDQQGDNNAQEKVAASLQLIILGGPGAGKGTQARQINEYFKIAHISTGAILRDEVDKGSDLGEQVKGIMGRGELVDDEIILQLVEQRLQQPDSEPGFILDGFPRTIPQAEGLELILKKRPDSRISVLYLSVSDEEMMSRLMQRGRDDDTEETVKNRIEIFHQQTDPLVDFYDKRGVLIRINGEQSIEAVAAEIKNTLESR